MSNVLSKKVTTFYWQAPAGAVEGQIEAYRERGAWQLRITLPEWVARDLRHDSDGDPFLFVGRPGIASNEGESYEHFEPVSSLDDKLVFTLELSPTAEELSELFRVSLKEDETAIEKHLADIREEAHKDLVHTPPDWFEQKVAHYENRGVHFTFQELKVLEAMAHADYEKRGEYYFSFDGKVVEGVRGRYEGYDRWAVWISGLHKDIVGPIPTPTFYMPANELEDVIWLLSGMLAYARGWTAFLDVTRPKRFTSRKV